MIERKTIEYDPCCKQEQLEKLCRQWQERLRLQDWCIRVRFARYEEINTQGQVTWEAAHPDARILIQPMKYSTEKEARDPLEKTLVHELLHLHYWWLTQEEGQTITQTQHDLLEQAIDKTAWALFELKYGAEPGSLNNYLRVKDNDD